MKKVCLLVVLFVFWSFSSAFTSQGGSVYNKADDIALYVSNASEEYALDEDLIYAVIETESMYDPEAYNESGCCGLMQVSKKWHQDRMDRLGVEDLFDAEENILVGCDYLSELLEDYELEFALMVYNQGYKSAKKTWDNYGQSSYSKKVMRIMNERKEP